MKTLAIVLLLVIAAGCAAKPANVDSSGATAVSAPAARIDQDALLKVHPFAPVLAQLDSDIATLQAAKRGGLSTAGAALKQTRAQLQKQLQNAETRTRAMHLPAPAPLHAPAGLRSLPAAAAVAQYDGALQARMTRALALREEQFREKEATVDYQFDRVHAAERLRLQLHLRSPYLDSRSRAAIGARLNALSAEEARIVAAQRASDAAALTQFRADLASAKGVQLDSMQRDLAAHASAVARIPRPSNAIVARAEAIPSRTDTAKTAAAFAQANDDLTARFSQLYGWNGSAAVSADDEIAALRSERDRLAGEMRAQIGAQAERIAKQRGLGKVYAGHAPPGSTDLTRAVAAALQAIRG